LILKNKHNNLEIVLEKSLLKEIETIAVQHYPNEFGGFLLGKYSEDFKSVVIESIILPYKYKSSPILFQRSIKDLEKLFIKEYQEKSRYYIGEWHSHPNGSTMYSGTDLNAMIETAESDKVQIKNPLLLIISISKKKMQNFTFYYYSEKKLFAYE
jgi:proteasome lid subunit RPN8/RPN11